MKFTLLFFIYQIRKGIKRVVRKTVSIGRKIFNKGQRRQTSPRKRPGIDETDSGIANSSLDSGTDLTDSTPPQERRESVEKSVSRRYYT